MSGSLYGVIVERGYIPANCPPEFQQVRQLHADQLEHTRSRYIATLSNADGTTAVSCVAEALDLALAPCLAVEALVGAKTHWTVWLGPEGESEVRRMAAIPA